MPNSVPQTSALRSAAWHDEQPYLASRLQGFGTTIFAEMSALAVETGAINLGQGFPDTDGPAEVAEAAIAAIRGGTTSTRRARASPSCGPPSPTTSSASGT